MKLKRLLAGLSGTLLLLPSVALAGNVAYTADTTVILDGSGITLTILSGSNADEVIVDSTTLTVTVSGSDTFTVKSPANKKLINDGGYDECDEVGGDSQVTINTPSTVIFTPSGSCSSGGGGGGGSSTVVSTTPLVDLTAPVSGTTLTAGTASDISWTVSGAGISTVKLEYSIDGGTTYSLIADNVDDGSSPYSWTVPAVSTTTAVVKISGQDTGKAVLDTDTSDVFTIAASTTTDDTPETPDGVTIDAEGRHVASGSGVFGASPYDGSLQEISSVETGWYVRSYNYPTVYYVSADGIRRPFWDANAYFTWTDSWDDVIWVTDATLPTMTLGSPMLPQPGVVLVKITSDPRVYAVEQDGETGEYDLRWITSETIASSMYGSAWADYVIDLDPTIFPRYSVGGDITSVEAVDMSIMKTRTALAALASGS